MITLRPENPSYDAYALVKMPNFWLAITRNIQSLLTSHTVIPDEVRYIADLKRWILIQMGMALHFERQNDEDLPRLSPKTLLEAVSGKGVASRNTIQSLLREMVDLQLIEKPLPNTLRQHSPQVSEKTLKLIHIYFDLHLRSLDAIDFGNRTRYLNANPAFLSKLQPKFARLICTSPRWYSPPEGVARFTNVNSGSSMLHDIILATDGCSPDDSGRIWISSVSSKSLSQKYNVSAAHVARLLNKAQKLELMGWERARRQGDCWVSQKLQQSYLLWQAEKLATLSDAFNEART